MSHPFLDYGRMVADYRHAYSHHMYPSRVHRRGDQKDAEGLVKRNILRRRTAANHR